MPARQVKKGSGRLFDATPPRTPKGTTWVIEVSDGKILTATLLGPP